ncbi:hypothetical protein N7495_004273 [Penicillium taxi]|uniref:uncharacterized protein n=1 Tax=Penicillium taxi TaxID=168475 RepID=UPI0025452B49|nr:uncharacterized protein N7495_004273 [Penicillium taxi]KAJ5899529.1 hypothetical protein N7495_004273 [Penicillium taxi]
MSFGRHAYRHAVKSPTALTLDHLWISDDLLAATFRRFANGQRRHGSCVPGPLEARRRLARRRNTDLAGIGGASAEDIACLFGRNGKEHMKWTDHSWQRTHLGQDDNLGTFEVPLSFYDHNPDSINSHMFRNSPLTVHESMHPTKDEAFDQFLQSEDWKLDDARDHARQLGIDLQREPAYSRQIFKSLLSRSAANPTQVIRFLDDPFLNTRGSGNYFAAVEWLVQTKTKRSYRIAVLNAVNRALELGLVSMDEICLIVKTLPNIIIERKKTLGTWDQRSLLKHYRALWKAIGTCKILGYRDLDKAFVDNWLEQLLSIRSFRFAAEIIIETHGAKSDSQWPSALILTWLENTDASATDITLPCPSMLLNELNADCAANCIIDVTERLVFSHEGTEGRNQLLELWRDCLLKVTNPSIGAAQVWSYTSIPSLESSRQTTNSMSQLTQDLIILRIWCLRSLCRASGPMYNQSPRTTDRPILSLLNLYEETTQKKNGSFLADFMCGIHNLDLPYNHLLLLAVDLKLKKLITKTTRKTLERLETAQTSLEDVWANPSNYKGIRVLFTGSYEQMLRRIDLTSPAAAENLLHLARTGDSESVWSLIRLLRNHTPMKICLHKAWVPIPHPDEKVLVRYHAGPRTSECPDPHDAVELIHQLAVAFSCCEQLTPSRSYHLIHWLYDYLRRHGGPVHPSLVRAMYHAGVVRYRRQGRRVPVAQYEYILWIVGKFEGPDVVEDLTAAPQIAGGRTDNRPRNCEV